MLEIPPAEAFTIQLAESGRFVDAAGAPYTPSPAPTYVVRRLNADGTYAELEDDGVTTQVQIGADNVVGVFKFTGLAEWAVDGVTLDILLTTTDAVLVALGRFFYERRVTVRVSAGADLGELTDPLMNPVPGSYPDGSAGQVLGLVPPIYTRALLIGTPQGRLEVPWPAAESAIELEVGDDYTADSGRLLPGRETAWWAVLNLPTAQSITLTATAPKLPDVVVELTIADDVLSLTQIQIQFPKAVTALVRRHVDYDFKVVAVLNASTHGGDTVTIWKGKLSGT